MGWRYFVIVMGGVALIMFLIRFAVFTIFESPKFHMGKGRDEEAVRIVHEVARRNGKTSNLTVDDLRICERFGDGQALQTDNAAAIKRKLAAVSGKHVKALFATRKMAFSTAAIMAVWAFIGLAFPLYASLPLRTTMCLNLLTLTERFHPIRVGSTRRRSRRWLNLHHIPQFIHYRCIRGAWRYARWCARRNPLHWPERSTGNVHTLDRLIHLPVYSRFDLERTSRMELRLFILLERHVRCTLRIYAGDLCYKRQRYG